MTGPRSRIGQGFGRCRSSSSDLTERGSIRIENGAYVAAKPNRPANQMSWDDGTAFADWAGLRPMSELEFRSDGARIDSHRERRVRCGEAESPSKSDELG